MNASPPVAPAAADAAATIAAPFDAEGLRARLPPLRVDVPSDHDTEARRYLAFYGLDLEQRYPGLKHHLGTFAAAGYHLVGNVFVPPEARGTALLLHGYYDHAGIFGHLIRYCLDRRLAVAIFDLPGHGLSSGEPATIASFGDYQSAFSAFLEHVTPLPRPWHLLSQSTGAAVAMEHLLANGIRKANSPFANVVLLAPLVRPHGWPWLRFAYHAARPFVQARPRLFRGENAEFVRFLREDDILQARTLPVAWVTAMVQWMQAFERHVPSDLPVHVIQGDRDRTVDWRYNLAVVSRKFDASVHMLDGAAHHLVNQPPALRERLFALIDATWGW